DRLDPDQPLNFVDVERRRKSHSSAAICQRSRCYSQCGPSQPKEESVQYVLLIYQGSAWATLPHLSEEKKSIRAHCAALNQPPRRRPAGAPCRTPRGRNRRAGGGRQDDEHEGPFVAAEGAVGGYVVCEADDLDSAVEVASRIPAARLGGAIEVRPVGTYW